MKIATYIISAFLTFALASQIDYTEQITISLSNPREPGHLTINHHKGSIRLEGYHGTSVIVRASMRYRTDLEPINLGAVESNNHVVINTTPRYRTIDLDIKVPHRFSLRLKNDDSGHITAHNLSGEMEISNVNGNITLDNLSGSAVLDTVDGNITVQFKDIAPGAPMAFSSVEGNIDIAFPKNVNTLIKVRADSGRITNDFDKSAQATALLTREVNSRRWHYDKLNDGGPEILLRSFLGNIYIRRQRD
ncbi:MAG: DUF4097 family beta strand repeat protein [Candidatus Hydrogenedentota bacterium]|nr:MAG: DUF4097 family beta strand repeat protein [Candidatus Hydrogenedentota bacterium]